jgi:two-component system sensor histidine kinase/response regulator
MIQISVTDTGVGINDENRGKLFQLFGRLESTSKMNTTGIGLGLSICKQILEAFNGAIYYEESSERGSTFTFMMECG